MEINFFFSFLFSMHLNEAIKEEIYQFKFQIKRKYTFIYAY